MSVLAASASAIEEQQDVYDEDYRGEIEYMLGWLLRIEPPYPPTGALALEDACADEYTVSAYPDEWDDRRGDGNWRHDLVLGDRITVIDDVDGSVHPATVLEWGRIDRIGMPVFLWVRLDSGKEFGIILPDHVVDLINDR